MANGRNRIERLAIAWIMVTASIAAVAAPPPPPPDFVVDMAKQLVPTQTPASFDGYAAQLANDLVVIVNGDRIAGSKASWLAIERGRLGKVDRYIYGSAEGRNDVLVLDRFDDRSNVHCPSGDGCVFDPRYMARALRYEIGPDHLVHRIEIVQSNGVLHPPVGASTPSSAR